MNAAAQQPADLTPAAYASWLCAVLRAQGRSLGLLGRAEAATVSGTVISLDRATVSVDLEGRFAGLDHMGLRYEGVDRGLASALRTIGTRAGVTAYTDVVDLADDLGVSTVAQPAAEAAPVAVRPRRCDACDRLPTRGPLVERRDMSGLIGWCCHVCAADRTRSFA